MAERGKLDALCINLNRASKKTPSNRLMVLDFKNLDLQSKDYEECQDEKWLTYKWFICRVGNSRYNIWNKPNGFILLFFHFIKVQPPESVFKSENAKTKILIWFWKNVQKYVNKISEKIKKANPITTTKDMWTIRSNISRSVFIHNHSSKWNQRSSLNKCHTHLKSKIS